MESLESPAALNTTANREPAAFASLPPELIGDILSHFLSVDVVDLDSLKAASLVSRTWRRPAQHLIWAAGAELDSDEDIWQWLKTRHRRRGGPKELAVHKFGGGKSLKRLFAESAGLRWLMLAAPGCELDPAVLAAPQLSHLGTLIVQCRLLPFDPSTVSFPFSLHTLVLADATFRSPHMAPFLTALASSSLSTLRRISLPSFSARAHPAVAKALLPFAAQLLHFGLCLGAKDDVEPYFPFLAAATSLHSLECTSLPPALLANLPPSLSVLATSEDAPYIDVEALTSALDRLKNLKRLYFAMPRRTFVKEVVAGPELLQKMEERGVDWRFAGDEGDEVDD
ncbi:hypothetical protein JCM8097_002714 [Rhodosporidiobolus ruineniae]